MCGSGGSSGSSSRGSSGHFELLDNALLIEVLKFVPVKALRLGVARACKRLHGPSMSSEAMSRTADMHLVCNWSKKTSAPTTAVLGALQRLNQDGGITRVVLVNSDFGKTTFKKLVKIVPLLTELDLGRSKHCYKNGCSDINVEAAPHLEVYRHKHGDMFTYDQAPYIELLRGRSKMRILELTAGKFTDAMLLTLAANCPNLEVLELGGWCSNCLDKLTDGGVHALVTGCTRLQKVAFSHKGWGQYAKQSGELTLHAVALLLALPRMAELRLLGFKFDDFCFKATSPATRTAEATTAAEDVRASILLMEAGDTQSLDDDSQPFGA